MYILAFYHDSFLLSLISTQSYSTSFDKLFQIDN